MHRSHVDHPSEVGGIHVLEVGASGEKCPVQVDGEQLFPVGEGEVDKGFDDLDASIADQDVDLAIPGDDLGHAFFLLRLVSDVHGHGESIGPVGLDSLGGGQVEVGNDRDAAFGGEAQGDFLADVAGRAGD